MTRSCGTTYGSIRNTDTFLFVISATNVFACEILKSVMFLSIICISGVAQLIMLSCLHPWFDHHRLM